MRIGNFKYKLVIQKIPLIHKLKKEVQKLFVEYGYNDVQFKIEGQNIICESLEFRVKCGLCEELNDELIRLGESYGYIHLSFPYWYYPK